MTKTLRGRVTLLVVTLLVPVWVVFAIAVYAGVREALYRELDAGLVGRARTLANAVERERQGWEFEFQHAKVPAFADAERPRAYFQIWLPGGAGVIRSESLGTRSLPRHAGTLSDPWLTSSQLPDGQPGRLCGLRFAPRLDESIPAARTDRYQDPVVLVVGQDARPVREALTTLQMWLAGSLAVVGVLIAGLVVWGVRRGLRPLDAIGRRIEAVDSRDLSTRLSIEGLPAELVGPVSKLNELLARLEQAFANERRFTADVSHELRTPLAGLRSLLEVAASQPRSTAEYQRTIQQALEIVTQLNQLSEDLLTLARLDAEQLPLHLASVDLRPFVSEHIARHRERAEQRNLELHNEVDEAATCRADPDKLSVALSNLLSNAVEYTESGGWVAVDANPDLETVIAVEDSGPPIPNEDLEAIFERFWRRDPARSHTGTHAGIGLPLAQAMCRAHGWTLEAHNTERGGVRLRIHTRT